MPSLPTIITLFFAFFFAIVGSEGNPDYLVIARQNGFILGVKPLVMFGSDASQYGFRLRMQKADKQEKVSDLPAAEKEMMLKTFSEIPWSKRSATRFSTMLLRQESLGWDFHTKVMEKAKVDLKEMLAEVTEKIAPIKLLNEADALEFLIEGYEAIVDMVKKQGGGKEMGEGEMAEILPFPGEDPTDI